MMESPVCSDACGSHTYSTCKECREYVCGACLLAHVCHPGILLNNLPDEREDFEDAEEAADASFAEGQEETARLFCSLMERLDELDDATLLATARAITTKAATSPTFTVEAAFDLIPRAQAALPVPKRRRKPATEATA